MSNDMDDQKVPHTAEKLCQCFGFTHADLHAMLRAYPHLDFEVLLDKTGAGSKCTACLLDLEFFFVEATKSMAVASYDASSKLADTSSRPRMESGSLKQRLYNAIDSISPLAHPPESQNYYLPVVSGRNVEEYLWIANRSMLFAGIECAPSMNVEVTVRNNSGEVVHDETYRLEQHSDLRLNVSQFLDKQDDELVVGSMRVARLADRPGFRGTTRPQFEILGSEGAACVHGQAPAPTAGSWQTFLCRPTEERVFLAIANATPAPMALRLSYPIGFNDRSFPPPRTITIPPLGAHLHEIQLNNGEIARFQGRPFSIWWSSPQPHKMYMLCSTPLLTHFSVDHL